MTNHDFATLSLDHLDTVTGGYHNADPTTPPPALRKLLARVVIGGVASRALRSLAVSTSPGV
jgi:hypothetical protein